MPPLLNWLLRLVPTNPICVRLVAGGSKRTRHLYIRSGYLAIVIVVLLFRLLASSSAGSLRDLASAGASSFQNIAYLQLALICLLAPVFMAGAIAQEANPKTWDILLTTPLNSLQVVLGNLFGRLFFILALLFSSLPLFAVMQTFGGVPGRSIFLSYVIAGVSTLLVGAIAIAMSVSRKAGKRAVFLFYVTVVIYIGLTWSIDKGLRVPDNSGGEYTTWFTPLNPFLALEGLLQHQTYHPKSLDQLAGRGWIARLMLGSPVASFCWIGGIISLLLISWSTLFLRLIGQRVGSVPWYQKFFKRGMSQVGEDGEIRRAAKEVWKNPIAWREASSRQNTVSKMFARWGFISIGALIAIFTLFWFHLGNMTVGTMQQVLLTIVGTEIAIIVLTAINISATAISREREDGTLDLLLTTPLTPGYYITGKLRGIIAFLLPMLAVPIMTALLCSVYVMMEGFGRAGGVTHKAIGLGSGPGATLPFFLPEGVLVLGALLLPFTAFCVMVGLHWSLKTKGTIGSVIAAVGIVVAVVGVLSLCGVQAGSGADLLGPIMCALTPSTAVYALAYPESAISSALDNSPGGARTALVIGAIIAGVIYSFIVYGIHKAMLGPNGRNFDMTVRRLAGTN